MAQYQITLDSQFLHQFFMPKSRDSGVSTMGQILKHPNYAMEVL